MPKTAMDNIVIVGSSGHAKVVIDIVLRQGKFNIVGLLDRFRKKGDKTLGYEILGTEEDLVRLRDEHLLGGIVVAIGDNHVRAQVAARVQEICPELPIVSAIHPSACIADSATIGEGTVVMAGAAINPSSTVGRCCILNTHSSLDHDSTMGDFASLAPRVATGGNCVIGECTAIGIGATLVHGVQVGEHTLIGAASLVLESIGSFVVAFGSPARTVRSRKRGEKYL